MFKHIFTYLVNGFFIKALGLISLPIYTYFLSPSEYGIYAIILSYISLGSILLNLNVQSSVSRFYYEKDTDVDKFVSTTIWLSTLIFLISVIFIKYLDYKWLSSMLGFDVDKYDNFVFLIAYCQILFGIYTQTLIPLKRSKHYSKVTSIKTISTISLSIVMLYHRGDVESILLSILTIEIFSLFYVFAQIRKSLEFKIRLSCTKYIVGYSFFLLPYSLSGIVLSQIDRIMIAKLDSLDSVGIYSVAYSLCMIPWTIFVIFSKGWTPEYFLYMNEEKYDLLDRDVKYILLMSSYIVIFLMLFMESASSFLFSDKYASIGQLLPVILSSVLFMILWQMWGRGIGYSRKTMYTSLIGTVSAIFNIFMNYMLIPYYGVMGAAYATYFSYMLMAVMGYFISKYHLNIYTVSVSKLKSVILLTIFMGFIPLLDTTLLYYIKTIFVILTAILIVVYFNRIETLVKKMFRG